MPITLNDCFANADLPPLTGAVGDAPGGQGARRRPCTVEAGEADRLVAAFLASGQHIKTYPAAYAAKSSQYSVPDQPAATH
jgi:hypothetical protein